MAGSDSFMPDDLRAPPPLPPSPFGNDLQPDQALASMDGLQLEPLSPRDSLQPPQPPTAPEDSFQPPEPPPPAPLPAFALERFFSRWEFAARHLLCCSDAEPLSMAELLGMADEDAAARWASLRLAYTETQGLPALREAIASTLYTSIAPHQVVVSAPQEAVLLCMQALLRPGDHVVCTFPGYQVGLVGCLGGWSACKRARSGRLPGAERRPAISPASPAVPLRGGSLHRLQSRPVAALQVGGRGCTARPAAVARCATDAERMRRVSLALCCSGADGAPAFRVEDAERLIVPGVTRLVIVNSPHNPSGAHFCRDEWRRLCALCESGGAYLFRSAAPLCAVLPACCAAGACWLLAAAAWRCCSPQPAHRPTRAPCAATRCTAAWSCSPAPTGCPPPPTACPAASRSAAPAKQSAPPG